MIKSFLRRLAAIETFFPLEHACPAQGVGSILRVQRGFIKPSGIPLSWQGHPPFRWRF